ncbi:MAG TPA: DUF6587 family protein [Ramlibacter sp.]|jgi:hypothetical protein
MVQEIIVGLIVIASAIYTFWLLAPAGVRRAGAAALAALARRFGLDAQASRQLQARLAEHGGCGDCKTCNHCATLRRPPPSRTR